jgi:hypothetical protein
MSVRIKIYQKLHEMEKAGNNQQVAKFCQMHLNILDVKKFKEFYTRYETWRLQQSGSVAAMRHWEKTNGRGIFSKLQSSQNDK